MATWIAPSTIEKYKALYESLNNLDLNLGAGLTAFVHSYEALKFAVDHIRAQQREVEKLRADVDALKSDLDKEIKRADSWQATADHRLSLLTQINDKGYTLKAELETLAENVRSLEQQNIALAREASIAKQDAKTFEDSYSEVVRRNQELLAKLERREEGIAPDYPKLLIVDKDNSTSPDDVYQVHTVLISRKE